MAGGRKPTKKTPNIYFNEKAQKNPYWFQVMVDGKRVTRRGFRTKGDAEKALLEIESSLTSGDYIDESKEKLIDFLEKWNDNRRNIAESTRDMYKSYLKIHIKPSIGNIPLYKITPSIIEDFINELRKKNLSDEMVKRIYAMIKAALNHAVNLEKIKKNAAAKIETPKVKKQERQIWKNESIKDILIKSKGQTRYWIAVFLALMTAMRQGEILGLKWSDIDFEKKIIHVKRSLRKDKVTFSDLKTEKSNRIIALSPVTIKVLEQQKELIEYEKSVLGDQYEDNDLVVCSSKGTPARATKVLHAWNRICEKFKSDDEPFITFHDLRHQSASIMLNDGIDIRIVSQRLGHSTVATTLNVYSHLLPTAQEEAALILDKSIAEDVLTPKS